MGGQVHLLPNPRALHRRIQYSTEEVGRPNPHSGRTSPNKLAHMVCGRHSPGWIGGRVRQRPVLPHFQTVFRSHKLSLFHTTLKILTRSQPHWEYPGRKKKINLSPNALFTSASIGIFPSRRVGIPDKKKEKYRNAIKFWFNAEPPVHALKETQELHGKLLHWNRHRRRRFVESMGTPRQLATRQVRQLLGPKPLDSNYSSEHFSQRYRLARMSSYMETTKLLLKAWKRGRSRSERVNEVFKRIHQLQEDSGCFFHARYIQSKENPADSPSRGIYTKRRLLPAPPFRSSRHSISTPHL